MKNYDQISLILTLKKRWILFLATLIICLVVGEIWAKRQIDIIRANKDEATKLYTKSKEALDFKTYLLNVELPKEYDISKIISDLLASEIERGCIDDFKQYVKTDYLYTYALFASQDNECINEIENSLNNNAIIKALREPPRFTFLGIYEGKISLSNQKPPNKHYIYLDKDRISSYSGYRLTSTQIISANASLRTNKIYVFVAISAIMIALFVTFGFESAINIKSRLSDARREC